jgi:glycosyltransferase involved in cell wall biosynthesis
VIVPSYNSARTIGRCLDSLIAQQTAHPYEIIVADSSTDETPQIVAARAPRVTLVRSERRLWPGPARNLGVARARADIVAFTDADCIVAPGWVEQIVRAHGRHDAVGGRILNGTPASLAGTALYLAEFVEFGGSGRRMVRSMPTCNLSYKKRLLVAAGGFPEVAWGEEYILNHRLPGPILFNPQVIVRHMNRTDWRETVRHAQKVGHGCALSRRATGQVRLLFRARFLVPLLWGWRFAKIGWSALRSGQALHFVAASPLLAVDLAAWTLGFWRGTAPPLEGAAGAAAESGRP